MNRAPEQEDEHVGIIEDYLGVKRRTLYIMGAIIAVVLVAVIGIYVSIWGFDHWKTNMHMAGDAMVINFNPQSAGQPAPQQAVQYTCPNCGAVGLPVWDAGVPRCPSCGRQMSAR